MTVTSTFPAAQPINSLRGGEGGGEGRGPGVNGVFDEERAPREGGKSEEEKRRGTGRRGTPKPELGRQLSWKRGEEGGEKAAGYVFLSAHEYGA